MRRRKKIVGVQVHHSVFLEDAMRGLSHAVAGLDSARVRRPDDPVFEEFYERILAFAREFSPVRQESVDRLRSFPEDVVIRCRDGEAPWPDEPAPWVFEGES